jgi:UDP-N-acetylglucosamine 1-carboxyvinyltransferase
VELPPPGGDVIGRRRLDTHFLALSRLGAEIEANGSYYLVTAKGTTRIRNAAAEPHVQDLCRFLNGLGARIEGVGTHILEIEGVDRLTGGSYRIGPDHVEVGSVIGLAAATSSAVTIADVCPEVQDTLRLGFARLGLDWEGVDGGIHVPADQQMVVEADFGEQIPKIDDGPCAGGPCSYTRRCSSRACSSSTSSSPWAAGSCSATRIAQWWSDRRASAALACKARTSGPGWPW